ncbi:MAG: FHA domain-containing protein [Anaerolineae bacterium]|nr:FHA domain-containing protein [Anaerolineae bacterium]
MSRRLLITFMSGAEDGRQVATGGPAVSIGREERNDIVVPFDSRVSRRHARIECAGDDLHITDLNSRNGTYLQDGSRITGSVKVAPGALFRLGRTWLKVERVD